MSAQQSSYINLKVEVWILSIVREINHVGIIVSDISASLRLYRDLLGGTIIRDQHSPDGSGRTVYVQLALGVVELIKAKFPPDTRMGFSYIAFLTAFDIDINTAADTVRSAGYVITAEPRPTMSGDGFLCFFKDAAGCSYELLQREKDTRISDLKNDFITKFDHISIRVDNESAANTGHLIGGVLGLPVGRCMEIGDNLQQSYCIGPDSIGLINSKNVPRPANPLSRLVFYIPDCFKLHQYLTENGIEASEVRPASYGDFNLFIVTGPDGEQLEFLDICSFNPQGFAPISVLE